MLPTYPPSGSRTRQRREDKIGQIGTDHTGEICGLCFELRIPADVERRIVRIEGDQTQCQQNRNCQQQQSYKFINPAMLCRDEVSRPTSLAHSVTYQLAWEPTGPATPDDSSEIGTRLRDTP